MAGAAATVQRVSQWAVEPHVGVGEGLGRWHPRGDWVRGPGTSHSSVKPRWAGVQVPGLAWEPDSGPVLLAWRPCLPLTSGGASVAHSTNFPTGLRFQLPPWIAHPCAS